VITRDVYHAPRVDRENNTDATRISKFSMCNLTCDHFHSRARSAGFIHIRISCCWWHIYSTGAWCIPHPVYCASLDSVVTRSYKVARASELLPHRPCSSARSSVVNIRVSQDGGSEGGRSATERAATAALVKAPHAPEPGRAPDPIKRESEWIDAHPATALNRIARRACVARERCHTGATQRPEEAQTRRAGEDDPATKSRVCLGCLARIENYPGPAGRS
jgi:hypothetical protein